MSSLLLRLGRLALIGVGVLAVSLPARAQAPSPDEREVVATIQKLFDAMASCDEAAIRAITVPSAPTRPCAA
jgi:hypothetical protein